MAQKQDIYRLLGDVLGELEFDQSLDVLSGKIGWSKFHLHRRFRRFMGETPKQYVLRLRLESAAALLSADDASVLSIALLAGFKSHEVFVRAFRRKYGCSPTHYRAEAFAGMPKSERATHRNLVRKVGPCIRQFYVPSIEPSGRQKMPMSAIIRKDVEAQPILYIQRRIVRTELQPLYAECFPKIFGHAMKAGLAMAGQPLARYVSTGAGLWTIDCAIPMAEPAPGGGEIEAGFLKAGPAAFAVHSGAYEQLPETNAAIAKWIEDNGYRCDGAPWESYVTDPAEYPDVADWKTEVFWPLAE